MLNFNVSRNGNFKIKMNFKFKKFLEGYHNCLKQTGISGEKIG